MQSKIYRYSLGTGIQPIADLLVKEQCFKLYVNHVFLKTIECTPSYLDELVIGNLVLNGHVNSCEEIESIKLKEDTISVFIISADKPNTQKSAGLDIKCRADKLIKLMDNHLNISQLHKLTGGVHIMSLAQEDTIIISREDLGRHNAVDKLYGNCLKNDIKTEDKIFLSSGRITSEIIRKVMCMKIPVIVSRAAVSSLAQEMAKKMNITVVGFVRGGRFNIYSHPERITT